MSSGSLQDLRRAIEAPLGAGGMGEVYKATDTRLDRTVAIKVLPAHVADDPDLRQRFEREAKTISSLNHPHICTLHDIGTQDGIDFLVMEYLDGETLAQRLEKGALPLDQALQIAIEIADALDKAHRQGIVHRDLKPGNIMLTKAGAKLLDFGLAKPTGPGGTGSVSAMPTQSAGLTGKGTILGTLQYMAPEQLEGKDVDARTDIFAFGTTVYEMVAGTKAFSGESQASVIAAVLDHHPESLSVLQAMSPPLLDQNVSTCLEKDPDARWQSIGDLKRQLKWIAEGRFRSEVSEAGPAPVHDLVWRPPLRVAIAGGLLAAVLAGTVAWVLKPSPDSVSAQFVLRAGVLGGHAISPDGTNIVFKTNNSADTPLSLRRLDQLEATPMLGTEGGSVPFFSPDGEWVGFTDVDGVMKRTAVAGGPSQTICDCDLYPTQRGQSWSPDDNIVFAMEGSEGLWRVPAVGGDPELLTTVDQGREMDHRWPDVLPSGNAVLFTAWSGADETSRIKLLSMDTGRVTDLSISGSTARYVPSGHIIYSAAPGTLRAVGFDAERLQLTSARGVPVLENVGAFTGGGVDFSVSNTGSLTYSRVAGSGNSLVWVDRDGREESLGLDVDNHQTFQLAPGGDRLAVEIDGDAGNSDIHVYDLVTRNRTQLTFTAERECCPLWSPDGERLVFTSLREGQPSLYSMPADGGGTETRLTDEAPGQAAYGWSANGSTLILVQNEDLFALALDSDQPPQRLFQSDFREARPSVSPDGRWIAYETDESGQDQVVVQPFPALDGHWVVSGGGLANDEPLWSRDGRELFFRSRTELVAVSVEVEPSFDFGSPESLFPEFGHVTGRNRRFDVSPDGQQFLIARFEFRDVVLVQNWLEELKARVPTGQ